MVVFYYLKVLLTKVLEVRRHPCHVGHFGCLLRRH
jgi:hypothetical protein